MNLDIMCQVNGAPVVAPDIRRGHRSPREVFEAWGATGSARGVSSALGMSERVVSGKLAAMGLR